MITSYKERGRSRAGKADSFTLQQLQTAQDAYDEEATLFVFRLKSLKQGQSRSLLTQAARHHAAQVLLSLTFIVWADNYMLCLFDSLCSIFMLKTVAFL